MIDTLKYAVKVYCNHHDLAISKYAEKCQVHQMILFSWFNHDKDMMMYSFEKIMKPLGYFFADQRYEVKKVYDNLGYQKILLQSGRRKPFVDKVIEGKKNISLYKYVEMIEAFGLDLIVRNEITEPLFAKYLTCLPGEKEKYAKQIQELEAQGIVDFNNEL